MKTEKISKLRNLLAEQGMELTFEEAKLAFNSANKLIKRSKRISQLDLWSMQDVDIEGMTEEEKQAAINLYQYIKDL